MSEPTELPPAATEATRPKRQTARAVVIASIALLVVTALVVGASWVLTAPSRVQPKVLALTTEKAPPHEGEPLQPSDDSFLIIFSGSGTQTLEIDTVDGIDLPMAISFTHDGERAFSVTTLDENGVEGELLVDTVGSYAGTVIANVYRNARPVSLEIHADGDWSFTIRTIYALPEFTTESTWGTGDMVLLYYGDATEATFTHDGTGPFEVWTYGDQPTPVVTSSGEYSGTKQLRAGPELIAISADGEWTIELEE